MTALLNSLPDETSNVSDKLLLHATVLPGTTRQTHLNGIRCSSYVPTEVDVRAGAAGTNPWPATLRGEPPLLRAGNTMIVLDCVDRPGPGRTAVIITLLSNFQQGLDERNRSLCYCTWFGRPKPKWH